MAFEKSVTAVLQARDSSFTSGFKKANGVLSAFSSETKSANRESKGFLGSIKSVATGMGLYKVAAMATAKVTNSVTGAMKRADTLYLFNRNITELTGSSKIAAQELKKLSATTTDTAYSLDAVANTTQSFANANISMAKSAKYSARFMDLVSRYGDGTNETFKQVTLQMNQMASKGKANLGDIKSAVEAQIPVWAILSKQTGKSVQTIQDEITAGKWTAEEFFDALMAGSENAAGAAKDGANTWAGALGIMNSRFTLGMTNILNSIRKVGEALTGDKFGLFKGITSIGTFAKESLTKVGTAIEGSLPFIQIFKSAMMDTMPSVKNAIQSVTQNIGFMNSNFTKTDALTIFSNVVRSTSQHIIRFANFVDRNSESIGKMIDIIPQAVAAIGTLKMINSVTTSFANFGLAISEKVTNSLSRLSKMNTVINSSLVTPIQKGMKSVGSAISSSSGSFILFNSNLVTSFRQIREFDSVGNLFKDSIRAVDSALDLSGTKLARFGSKILHPVQSITTFKTNMMLLSASAEGAGTVMNGVAIRAGQAFKSMSTVGIGAIRSLSAAMLSNPITAILMGITVAIGFVALSWRSNFMNIQGVVSSFASGVGKSISSLKDMFRGMEPVVQPTINVLKALGVILTGTLLVGIGSVIDALRLMVFALTSTIKAVQALGQGIKGLWQRIKGDSKGADESFKKMGKSIDSIGESFDSLKKNSAMKSAITSMNEFGKSTDDAAKKSKRSISDVVASVDELNAKTNEINSDFSLAFNVEGQTDGIKKYVASATQIMDDFNKRRLDTVNQYNDLMSQAEQAKGKERVALEQEANNVILSQTKQSNQGMLALAQEFSNQLKSNKNVEGEALTEEQRSAMEAQLEVIRQGLMQQNELYVQASMQKLANGESLSEQEQKAAEANLKALYANQTEQVTANEQKMADLRKQFDEAKTESQKANIQAQIEALGLGNEQLLAQQQAYGEQELALLLNGNEMTAQAVLEGLSGRKDITDEQLGLILQSFSQSNNDVGESLTILAGIMQERGINGANKLSEALKSGDLTSLAGQMTAEVEAGLQSLPQSMFWSGNTGKSQFIQSLKNGESPESAGRWLADGVKFGMATLPSEVGTVGSQAGQNAATSLGNTKGLMNNAGVQVADGGYTGANSKTNNFNTIGRNMGTNQATSLGNTKGANNSAGIQIADGAYSGANSRTGEFNSIGRNMGLGVAAGMNSALPDVTAAANAIVKEAERAANAKALIKSPSRLFMRVGDFIGQGVAVGINNSIDYVKENMMSMIDQARSIAFNNNPIEYAFSSNGFDINQSVSVNNQSETSELLHSIHQAILSGQSIYIDGQTLLGYTNEGLASTGSRSRRRSFGNWQA